MKQHWQGRVLYPSSPWLRNRVRRFGQGFLEGVYQEALEKVFIVERIPYQREKELNNSIENQFFRILLFKLFNRIETWEALEEKFSSLSYQNYSFEHYDDFFTRMLEQKQKIYSGAYIMASGSQVFGNSRKQNRNFV